MSEVRLTIDQLKFTYDGIFDLPNLYNMIDAFFYDRGWDRYEKLNTEQILPTGRSIKIEKIPFKNITDYFQIQMKIRLYATDVKRVDVEKDGSQIPLYEGKVKIVIDGYVKSDRYHKWEKRPLQWFFRTIFDKYVFKDHTKKAERWLYSDVEELYLQIKRFLNVYRRYNDRDVLSKQWW